MIVHILQYDRERKYNVRGGIAYDGTTKRIKEFEDEEIGTTKQTLVKLKLYEQNKEYILDVKTKKCNVSAPTHPFHPYGVPDGAKYFAEAVVGATGIPGEFVVVADFGEKSNDTAFFVTVTEPHCFPVNYGFFSKDGVEHTTFYDLQDGISDPQAFAIPSECPQ